MLKHPLFLVSVLIILSLTADLGWRAYTRLFHCPLVKAPMEESPLDEDLAKAHARLAQWKLASQSVVSAQSQINQTLHSQGYQLQSDDLLWPVTGTGPATAPLILAVSDVTAGPLVESTMERLVSITGNNFRPVAVAVRFGKSQAAAWPAESAVIELAVTKGEGVISLKGEFHSRGLVDALANGLSRYCTFPLACMKATISGKRTDFQLAKVEIPLDETPRTLTRVSGALGKTIALMTKGTAPASPYVTLSMRY